ncbi:class F sortase [Frondihabitans peucedani]|uniref:class F sortase n=1 Tax=Frondihabitans peucedani TaxID=598626 RepID=UPI0031DD245A
MTTRDRSAARVLATREAALPLLSALSLVTALTLTGCTSLNSDQDAVPTGVPSDLTSTTSPTPAPSPEAGSPDGSATSSPAAIPQYRATIPPVAPAAAAPARVSVAWAGVKAAVVPVGIDSAGDMDLPPNPAEAGWYRYSAAPSASEGTTVMAAHVDAVGYGVGPFAHLVNVPKGTAVTVTDTAGAATEYRIDSVSLLTKTTVPWKSIFTTGGAHRLVLVTCGGAFDYTTHHYLSNLVIVATPA